MGMANSPAWLMYPKVFATPARAPFSAMSTTWGKSPLKMTEGTIHSFINRRLGDVVRRDSASPPEPIALIVPIIVRRQWRTAAMSPSGYSDFHQRLNTNFPIINPWSVGNLLLGPAIHGWEVVRWSFIIRLKNVNYCNKKVLNVNKNYKMKLNRLTL